MLSLCLSARQAHGREATPTESPAATHSPCPDPALNGDVAATSLFDAAVCQEGAGNLARASALYSRAVEQASLPEEAELAARARNAADALSPKLSRLVLYIGLIDREQGVTLTIDGATVPLERVGHAIVVEPGWHLIVASRAGALPWSKRLETHAGDQHQISVPTLATALHTLPPPQREPLPRPATQEQAAAVLAELARTRERELRIVLLQKQLLALHREREDQTLAGPICVLVAGIAVSIGGTVYLVDGLANPLPGSAISSQTALGVGAAVGGGVLALIGGVSLHRRLAKRRVLDEVILKRTEELSSDGGSFVPPDDDQRDDEDDDGARSTPPPSAPQFTLDWSFDPTRATLYAHGTF